MRLLLTVLVAACGGGDSSAGRDGPVRRDSAGVRIVENGLVQPGSWSVSSTPLFTVGWDPGEPTFTWTQSGRILPDGGALVGDFNAGAIYRLGPDGSVLATWGRKGEGPGEFQALDAILFRGDSILVSDGRLQRMTYLSLTGDVLATRPLTGGFRHQVSSMLDDGRVLLIPGDAYSALTETRPEWAFDEQPILAAAIDGATVDTLAVLPHMRRWYGTRAGTPGAVHVKGRAGGYADGFAWGRADRPEVRWYDGAGNVVQIARWDEAPAPLTAEFRRRWAARTEESLRSRGADEAAVKQRLAQLDEDLNLHDGPLPYWDELRVDRAGNVWLRQYGIIGEPEDRWRAIARNGTLVGWVDVPDVVAILDITDDRILAVRFDELDVPAVVMLELLKE